MPASHSPSVNGLTERLLYPRLPRWAIYLCVIALAGAYTIVLAHTPLALYPAAAHDDGLFIRLAETLARGEWLGPFNQFTLMKGPGYPAFLALSHWLGISVSLAHALFHCVAITLFVVVVHRFVGSLVLSGLLLALLLWHPISMSSLMLRVWTKEIGYAELLMLLAALIYALFYPSAPGRRRVAAALAGAVLGWFWLTREEAVWILPAIALLLGVAALRDRHTQRLRELAGIVVIFAAVFAASQIGFRAANLLAYGKFVGVDMKERNFERALAAIDSVRSGGTRPFVSITQAARERAYAVSPAFASLASYLDGPQSEGWRQLTCGIKPVTCGEIGIGALMWALRDAAAAAGHYQSPAAASDFFGRIADEITAACARGALQCSSQLIGAMPPVTWGEIAQRLPSRLASAYHQLLLVDPPLNVNPSIGTQQQLDASLRFLNYPPHTALAQSQAAASSYTLAGWYYKSGSEWFWAEVRSADGAPAAVQIVRNPSTDLIKSLGDTASRQRFVIRTHCNADCTIEFTAPDGAKVDKRLGDLPPGLTVFELGAGHVYIESTTVESDPEIAASRTGAITDRIRFVVASHYHWLFVPVLVLGLAAFAAATALRWRPAWSNMCYVLALMSWMLVALLTALLILIDVTAFPALQASYLAPAYFFLVGGAVLSCAAWLQLFVKRTIDQETADSASPIGSGSLK